MARGEAAGGARPPHAVLVSIVAIVAVVGMTLALAGLPLGADPAPEATEPQPQVTAEDATLLEDEAATIVRGTTANASLGESVAVLGDVDGSGTDDMAVGAPGAGEVRDKAKHEMGPGEVSIFFGPVDRGELTTEDADVVIEGADAGDMVGADVAAGDLTGDGHQDVVVGAPGAGEYQTGQVGIFFGATLADTEQRVAFEDADVVLMGDVEGGLFGLSVTTVDGVLGERDEPAVAVGQPGADHVGQNAGAAVLFAAEQFTEGDAHRFDATDADATLTGIAAADHAGWSVAAVENVTHESEDGLLVGAPHNDSTDEDAGAAYLATAVEPGSSSLEEADAQLHGEAAGDRAGWAVADAGDVAGDDVGDVLVGAPFSNETDTHAGAAYVVHGDGLFEERDHTELASADTIIRGESAGDYAGWAVAAADCVVTCDEYADVAIGAPGNDTVAPDAGLVALVTGEAMELDEIGLGGAQATYFGEKDHDAAGSAVAGSGDVTGNDADDLLAGAPGRHKGAGAAYVIEGEREPPKKVKEPRRVVEPREPKAPKPKHPKKIVKPKVDAHFAVEIVDKNDPVEEGETLEVTVVVANTGSAAGTQDIRMEVGGVEVDVAADVHLEPKETETLTLTWEAGTPGKYILSVLSDDDVDSQAFLVTSPEQAFFAVDIEEKNDPVEEGETLKVTANVTNVGDLADTQDVRLEVDGEGVDRVPNVGLSGSESQLVDLEWTPEEAGNYTVTVLTDDDSAEQDVEVTERDPAFFAVEITAKNDPVNESELLEVEADISNVGGEAGTQDVRLEVDGEEVDRVTDVSLEPTETEPVDLEWTPEEAGNYTVTVLTDDDYAEQDVEVIGVDPAFFDVEIAAKNDPVNESETLEVEANVTNVGGETGTQDVRLEANGTEVDRIEDLTLEPTENESVNLTWTPEEAGTYNMTVLSEDDSDNQTIDVLEPPVTALELELADEEIGFSADTAFTVTAHFADGTSADVTEDATVTTDDDVVTVGTEPGTVGTIFSAEESGTATITAEYRGEEDTAELTVVEPDLLSIDLELDQTELEVDESASYSVLATYEQGTVLDVTAEASVTSDDQGVATVDETTQTVTATGEGTATITAAYEGLESTMQVSVSDSTEGITPQETPPEEESPPPEPEDEPEEDQDEPQEEPEPIDQNGQLVIP